MVLLNIQYPLLSNVYAKKVIEIKVLFDKGL